MGALEDISDLGKNQSSENSMNMIHANTANNAIDNQTGESYRSLAKNGVIV